MFLYALDPDTVAFKLKRRPLMPRTVSIAVDMAEINFKVNGVDYTVSNDVKSTTSLLDYLREVLEFRGTKYMCKGGRCGACLVSVNKSSEEAALAVNSCLVPITSCHNWEVTTIEKVGNRHDGYHTIQQKLAENNGTQCGYCTPGWVMALYSLLKGKGELTMLEIEQSLGSNICRCTGYRSIIETFKTFGKDAPVKSIMDIEELKICDKTGTVCTKRKSDDADWCVVTENEVSATSVIQITLKDGKEWYRVEDIFDVFKIFLLKGTDSYMLVHGNTVKGLITMDEYPDNIIDISGISSLKGSVLDQNLEIGSGMTITEMINVFEITSSKEGFSYLKEFNNVLKYVANVPVKNIASVGGNLMMTHQTNGAVSDLVIMFEAVGATVTIINRIGMRSTLSLAAFFKEDMTGNILLNILLPPLSTEYKVVAYKIAGKTENAGSILCAAFMYKTDLTSRVLECRISLGLTYLTRATNTERYLLNKVLFNNETLQGAVTTLNNELIVTDKAPATSAKYRKKLAIGLFYKSLLSICPPGILTSRYVSGAIDLRKTRPLSQARQLYDTNSTLYPLNQAIPKVEALIQCAGEATFSDDIPAMPREVFAIFVLSTVAVGTIENIDASTALSTEGVVAFYTAKDIPGVNSFTAGLSPASLTAEEVLCDGQVKYYNQPIGIIVAESQHIAEQAAKLVTVTYTNTSTPVLDVAVAKDDSKRTSLFSEIAATETGKNVTKVVKGDITIRGQYHSPMETLICVSHPTDEGIKVYTASQYPDTVQYMTSRALNVPQNKIDVEIRRVGGSYGIKISRSTQIAVACNLVVKKLHRPCRFIQNLKTNMKAVGKRLPCHADFEIGVDSDGVIQYNNYNLYEDNGYLVNEPLVAFTLDCYSNCYKSPRWNYKIYNTVTDTASNTWCRSPGSLECISMAELMMEQIACEMSLDPIQLRLSNLDTDKYDAVREMYEKIRSDSQYTERKAEVEKFNKENRWKKQGLGCAFMIWNPLALPLYFNVHLSIYFGDGSVIITHSGVEMGQGINTKAAQICAHLLNISVDKIHVKATDTITCANSFPTAGSIGSTSVGLGVVRCCKEIWTKLDPVKAKLDNPTWLELVTTAYGSGVDLSAHAFVNINDNVQYSVHGVGVAQVEIDVLTGESQILRVDLAQDVGQSVSPGVDLGQVEGAFMMGVGYWTSERLVYSTTTGELLTDSFHQYWVPQLLDIPQDLRTYFRSNSYSHEKLLGSKGTGEPASCLGVVVPIAMREGIVSARGESGISATEWFKIDGPYTVEKIHLACNTRLDDFKFY